MNRVGFKTGAEFHGRNATRNRSNSHQSLNTVITDATSSTATTITVPTKSSTSLEVSPNQPPMKPNYSSVSEKILLAKTEKIVEENNEVYEQKNVLKKIVSDGLSSLHYDSSICKTKWDKLTFYPGEYEFIDVIVKGERVLIDVDFRSEFEIARPTQTYKTILQSLPFIFVGKPKRLTKIILIISEEVKKSLRKKKMHVPPWRQADYMLAKWLSLSCVRAKQPMSFYSFVRVVVVSENRLSNGDRDDVMEENKCSKLELIFGEKTLLLEKDEREKSVLIPAWQPPMVKPKCAERKRKLVNGLASLLNGKP
ncbi:hypothetical protein TanjilG_20514 [Lupinus angustifolius]|uniref:Uncharacterized protein n=1 Tax=Lupinus angustifolius TaxID=3871 RepID=A0A1J7H8U7_LUPAN|nr:hypothetical protein TanjilG_20514 [Lupinus angustifolius]